jgi:3-deoxy-D-manno-octulosonic-acid transferase
MTTHLLCAIFCATSSHASAFCLETEIWFNLIHGCHSENTPLLLLNARLSEKSSSRYALFPKLTRQGLSELHSIAAQTDSDAKRLLFLGAENITLMGNLKFDIEPPPAMT